LLINNARDGAGANAGPANDVDVDRRGQHELIPAREECPFPRRKNRGAARLKVNSTCRMMGVSQKTVLSLIEERLLASLF
jgi:hypothetical protein